MYGSPGSKLLLQVIAKLCTLDYIIHNSGTLMVHFVSLFVVSICLLHIVFALIYVY